MATLRTFEEKAAIVARCVELEKTGGDILGYLWSENYYTPRATWFNFQREWLHRKPYEYTDGKPKGEKKMTGMNGKTKEARQKRLDELKKRIGEGMGIRAALAEMGFKSRSAGQIYRQIRNFAQANDPETYAILPEKISDEDAPVEINTPEMPTVKVDGPIRIETQEAKKVEVVETPEGCSGLFRGTKGEKAARITKPVIYDGLIVTAVTHPDLGEFYYDKKFASIDWRTPEGDEVSLTPAWWIEMAHELKKILNVLGVDA